MNRHPKLPPLPRDPGHAKFAQQLQWLASPDICPYERGKLVTDLLMHAAHCDGCRPHSYKIIGSFVAGHAGVMYPVCYERSFTERERLEARDNMAITLCEALAWYMVLVDMPFHKAAAAISAAYEVDLKRMGLHTFIFPAAAASGDIDPRMRDLPLQVRAELAEKLLAQLLSPEERGI